MLGSILITAMLAVASVRTVMLVTTYLAELLHYRRIALIS